ncbi:pyridine nucleotide-disulfide oxidoreductase domain-containing protein 2 [Lepeophtheirus salmonis]|uniref:pyridine nucleotide-disulfide oxidoreductase domain-containing protein 2 n=1 Tax=Lepeophtheirus salmonis TaxID=72036 RepID=UPI001AE8C66F|nr:pyridine nucleotide-disulfide oxidoreductase domain-containing protein 2-like [Lepeophtheirus salmonis]
MRNVAKKTYDTIVVGGNLNGLIASAYLATSGKKVALFEKKFSLENESYSLKMHSGLKYSRRPPIISLPERIILDLNLNVKSKKHSDVTSITPIYGYNTSIKHLTLGPDPIDSIRHFSSGDAERYKEFLADMKNASFSLKQRSCRDILNDYFDFAPLKSTLASKWCFLQGECDPDDPQSGQSLRNGVLQEIHYPLHLLAEKKEDSFVPFIRRRAVSLGVDIFCGGGVREIRFKSHGVSGISLANGMECLCSSLLAPNTCSILPQFKMKEGLVDDLYIGLERDFFVHETYLEKLFNEYPGCPLYLNCESFSPEMSPVLKISLVKSNNPELRVLKVAVFSLNSRLQEAEVTSLLDKYIPGLSNSVLGTHISLPKHYIDNTKMKGLYLYDGMENIHGKIIAESLVNNDL